MGKIEVLALILAGGQGNRLGLLTKNIAKPAVNYGAKYRIIDFTLSNCINSDIFNIGIITQYQPLKLNSYAGIGNKWGLNSRDGEITILPPYLKGKLGQWYKGTADAVYQNFHYIDQFDPKYILILSGDHIYKMNYSRMLEFHNVKQADATISVIEVPWEEAGRFGIMNTGSDASIYEFEEKPSRPKNNLASMGIYIFNWQILKQFLMEDSLDTNSSHDFGKNIIPWMMDSGLKMFAYPFQGYWKDVGTVHSYWESNMDLLEDRPQMDLNDPSWPIYSENPQLPPHFIAPSGAVNCSVIGKGSSIYGHIDHSVIFHETNIGKGSYIKDSVIMPGVVVGDNVEIYKSIVCEGVKIGNNCRIGFSASSPGYHQSEINSRIVVIGEKAVISDNSKINKDLESGLTGDDTQNIELEEITVREVKAG